MADARLFVLPLGAASFAPLEDLLRSLMTQGLVDPGSFCHVVPPGGSGLETDGLVVRTLGRTSDDDRFQELNTWILDQGVAEFILINVVTVDALVDPANRRNGDAKQARGEFGDPAPELQMAIQVEEVIRPAIDQIEAGGSVLHVLNLVFPPAVPKSMPWDLWWGGNGGEPWRNAIVVPEVQITSHHPSVLVDADEDYVAHVASGMLVLVGVWSGVERSDALFNDDSGGYDWMVVKTRARTVMAPELPRRVLGRIGTAAREVPVDESGTIQFAKDEDPQRTVSTAVHRLVEGFSLNAAEKVSTAYVPPRPRRVKIREYLRILMAWMSRRIPEMVATKAADTVKALRKSAENYVNGLAGLGEGSSIKIGWGPEEEAPLPLAGAPGELTQERRRGTWSAPQPALWAALRSTCFGLLDGGQFGDTQLDDEVSDGPRRRVLAKPEMISPAPDSPIWSPSPMIAGAYGGDIEPSEHLVDIGWIDAWEKVLAAAAAPSPDDAKATTAVGSDASPDPTAVPQEVPDPAGDDLARLRSARSEAKVSLLWGLGEHLFAQRTSAQDYFDGIRNQLEKAEAETTENIEALRKEGRSKLRRKLLIGLAVLAVAGIVLTILLPLISGVALVVIAAVAGVAWLWGLLRVVVKWVYGQFLLEHKLHWLTTGQKEVLRVALVFARGQLTRFDNLVMIERDWSDIIGTIIFHPFGTPRLDKKSRIRQEDLGLPRSHQSIEGFTTPDRFRSIAGVFLAREIRPGWLTRSYSSAITYVEQVYLGPVGARRQGVAFEPDDDTLPEGNDDSPRRVLVAKVRNGEARQSAEIEQLKRIEEGLRSPEVFGVEGVDGLMDFLFTPDYQANRSVAQYLAECRPEQNERPRFNGDLVPMLDPLAFDDIPSFADSGTTGVNQTFTIPPPEALLMGVRPKYPYLAFSTWCVLGLLGVPSEEVGMLAGTKNELQAVNLRLDDALNRWKPPVVDDFGTVRVSDGDHGDWTPGASPFEIGEVIARPSRVIQPTMAAGPYAFTLTVDGSPVTYPPDVPIKVAVRADCAPPNAYDLVKSALQCLADSCVFTFVYDGTFDGPPANVNGRIEIGWAQEEEFCQQVISTGRDPDNVIGLGGPATATGSDGGVHLAGGSVLLRAAMDLPVTFEKKPSHGQVLLHELGHAMNLGHVNDVRQVMNPSATGGLLGTSLEYGSGDRLGLFELHLAADDS